jgi:hypothetical protein
MVNERTYRHGYTYLHRNLTEVVVLNRVLAFPYLEQALHGHYRLFTDKSVAAL